MKIVVDGHKFDTSKAKRHYTMANFDGHNQITGDLYISSKGQWYMYSPSQWGNGHRWQMTSPEEILEQYREFFDEKEIEEISAHVEGWE